MKHHRPRPNLRVLLPVLALSACTPDPGDSPADEPAAEATRPLPEGAQAFSLLGEPLYPNPAPPEIAAQQAEDIDVARADYEADPDDADAIIWLGRRIGYTGLYREAIEVFSEGIEKHPGDARMFRHRGHRWISGCRSARFTARNRLKSTGTARSAFLAVGSYQTPASHISRQVRTEKRNSPG